MLALAALLQYIIMKNANSAVQSQPIGNAVTRVLFVPVSGPIGIGEYQRSLFLAQSLTRRHPDWDIRIVVAETAPFVDEVPLPIFRTTRSPTKVPGEVNDILREFRPGVVIFDCSGRKHSLRIASQLGARIIFVSNHRRKRRRGFRISRLRHTDDHWILPPHFITGDLTAFEQFKLHLLKKPAPIFIGPVFPEAKVSARIPDRPFFVCCPGGGGNKLQGRQSGAVFADAARDVAGKLGIRGVVVTGRNFTGELPASSHLQVYQSLPGDELAGLLSGAEFALVGGGDLLPQSVANRVAPIATACAADQQRRITAYEQRGLCISAPPERLAEVAIAAYADGRVSSLAKHLQSSDIENGLNMCIERIEMLAGGK